MKVIPELNRKIDMKGRILIVDAGADGHHITYLRFFCTDFLALGYEVHLALGLQKDLVVARLTQECPDLMQRITVHALAKPKRGFFSRYRGGSFLKASAMCMRAAKADHVFFAHVNSFMSRMCYKVVLSMALVPRALRGRCSGLYINAHCLHYRFKPNRSMRWLRETLKYVGFSKLCRAHYFSSFFILNETLLERAKAFEVPFHFLPDAFEPIPVISKQEARKALDLPQDRVIFFLYGHLDKRKGVHVLLSAYEKLSTEDKKKAYVLCAGKLDDENLQFYKLSTSKASDGFRVDGGYVPQEKQALYFYAADWILLPYINHLESSNVLALAAGSQRPVIVSDCPVLKLRTQRYGLGECVPQNDAQALSQALSRAIHCPKDTYLKFQSNALDYQKDFSRDAFSKAIASVYGSGIPEVS